MNVHYLNEADRTALQERLLRWYDVHQRPLPWRLRPTAYGTWISEIMLQQTTVQTVVPYWLRFLDRFPDVSVLAAASEEEVLSLWSGLGYYRRARRLHQAARQIVSERGCNLPCTRQEWSTLPGIGRYSAGAIASIAQGEQVAAVDANVRRVLTRWSCDSVRQSNELSAARLELLAQQLVAGERPGAWNQALMELGSIHCHPISPDCIGCPVARFCRAHQADVTAEVPAPIRRKQSTAVTITTLVARGPQGVMLWPAAKSVQLSLPGYGPPLRHDVSQLWPGLWAPPCSSWYPAPSEETAKAWRAGFRESTRKGWQAWLGLPEVTGHDHWTDLGTANHAVTTYRLALQVIGVSVDRVFPAVYGGKWFRPDRAGDLPLSALARKVLSLADSL